MGRTLVVVGLIVAGVGALMMLGLPLGRLPGGAIVAYDGSELRPGPRSDTILRPPTALVRFDGARLRPQLPLLRPRIPWRC